MKPATLIALFAAAAAVGVAAYIVDRRGRAVTEPAAAAGMPGRVLEGLAARVNDAASVTIKRPGVEFTVARRDTPAGPAWSVVEKGGYPVRIESVKELIVGLAELKPLEPKTSRPERYKDIGVQDPDAKAPDGSPVGNTGNALVTVKDAQGAVLASAIVGNIKYGASPLQNSVFIRRAGEAQSWLAQGKVEVPTDAMAWMDRQIINLPRERVRSVTIEQPDGQGATASREKPEDAMFAVQDVPAGRELNSASEGERLGSALSYTTFDDVAPAAEAGFVDPSAPAPEAPPEGVAIGPRVEARTFDGLIVSARLISRGGKTWARFDAAFDEAGAAAAAIPEEGRGALKGPEAVRKEAADLHERLAPWAFQIPEYKAKSLSTRMDELLKPLATPGSNGADGAGAPPTAPPLPQSLPPPPAPTPPTDVSLPPPSDSPEGETNSAGSPGAAPAPMEQSGASGRSGPDDRRGTMASGG